MKKLAGIISALIVLAAPDFAADRRIGLTVSYFSSENSIFRDVYGGAVKFGLEGGLNVAKNLSVWIGVNFLHKTGALTVTEEESKVRIVPLTAGLRYEIPAGKKIVFHAGAGIQEVFFKEESVLGTVRKNALGFMLKGGGVFRFSEALGAGLFVSWSTCKMKNEDVEFKVGGLDIGAGIEFRF